MTKASAGFQRPSGTAAKSRNASTTAGSIIRERLRPAPKRRPAAKAASRLIGLAPEHMTSDKHDGGADGHESQRRRQGSRRQASEPADAVAAGTAVAEPRTEADQQAGDENHRNGCIDADLRQRCAEQRRSKRPSNEPRDKGQPPAGLAGAAAE